jgi:quercetin dioxygenase-like cupin family protein
MLINRKKDGSVVLDKDGATGISLISRNGCEVVELTLEQGAEIPHHALPFPVTFYIAKGSGMANVDGQIVEASQGDVIAVGPGSQRSWSTKADGGIRLLVIKHIE